MKIFYIFFECIIGISDKNGRLLLQIILYILHAMLKFSFSKLSLRLLYRNVFRSVFLRDIAGQKVSSQKIISNIKYIILLFFINFVLLLLDHVVQISLISLLFTLPTVSNGLRTDILSVC